MQEFTIDIEYLTSVEDNKIMIMQGREYETIGHKDHPEFNKLREQLGAEGYIEIENGWWNGDRALKPFKLNGYVFEKDDKFPCASAMGVKFRCWNREKT